MTGQRTSSPEAGRGCTTPGQVHAFAAKPQPATNFVDRNPPRPIRTRLHPRRQLYCYDCGRLRTAANLHALIYYDCLRFTCREGHVLVGGRWPRYVTLPGSAS